MTKLTQMIKILSVMLCFSVVDAMAQTGDMSKCTYNAADDTYTCPDSKLGEVVVKGKGGNSGMQGITNGLSSPKADQIVNVAGGTRAVTNEQAARANAPLSGAGLPSSATAGTAAPSSLNTMNIGDQAKLNSLHGNLPQAGITSGLNNNKTDQIVYTASGTRAVSNEQAARANAPLSGAGLPSSATAGTAAPSSLNTMNIGYQAKLNSLHGNLPMAGITCGLSNNKTDQIARTASGTRAVSNEQLNKLNAPLSGPGLNIPSSTLPTQINYQDQGGLVALQKQLDQEAKGISPAAMVGSSASSQTINMKINTDAFDPGKQLYNSQQANVAKAKEAQSAAAAEIQRNNQRVENMAALTKEAQDYVAVAQKRLKEAKTPEEMAAANAELQVALKDLEKAKDNQKQVEKDVKKENKELQKTADKESKEALKENEKVIKNLEKEQKTAQKDLDKANKEIKKLEEKCGKGKCDDKDLAKLAQAREDASAAQDALTIANGKLDAATGAAYADNGSDASNVLGGIATDGGALTDGVGGADMSDDLSKLDAQGVKDQINAPKLCQDANGIFEVIACKAVTTLADIRVIAYIISGFGMVAFAYGAIFGKISFKQLANIGIGLFMLSMMTPFIEYFTQKPGGSLKFGQYLPAGFTDVAGSDMNQKPCTYDAATDTTSGNCPDVEVYGVDQSYKKEKWSLKDLKGSIQSGLEAVRSANNMYQATKSTITNVSNQVNNMKAAIKTGGGGLDGIINGVNAVANAGAGIANSGKLLANNLATNSSTLSNSLKDAGSTNAAREKRAEIQGKSDSLTKKCNAGNCSENEKRQLEVYNEYLQQEKTGVDKWMENDGTGGGATILSGINKVNDLGAKVAASTHVAANAAHEGQTIGGGGAFGSILGAAMGAGTAYVEGSNMAESNAFNFQSAATTREKQAAAEKAAFEKTSGFVKNTQEDDAKKVETRGDGSIKTTNKQTGVVTVVNPDGSVEATSPNGSKVVKKADGSRVETNSNGLTITYDKNGNEVSRDTSGVKVKFNAADSTSVSNALAGKGSEAAPAGTAPKKDEEKKEEAKTPAAPSDTAKVTEEGKKQRKAACSSYSGDAKAGCEACAVKDTEGEYKSCLQKMNSDLAAKAKAEQEAKAKADKEAKEKAAAAKAATSTADNCTPNFKEQCFGEPEGANAQVTANCKKCNFRMAISSSSNNQCATLKSDKEQAARNYKRCNETPGRDCNPESEKAAELAQRYKKECPNG